MPKKSFFYFKDSQNSTTLYFLFNETHNAVNIFGMLKKGNKSLPFKIALLQTQSKKLVQQKNKFLHSQFESIALLDNNNVGVKSKVRTAGKI